MPDRWDVQNTWAQADPQRNIICPKWDCKQVAWRLFGPRWLSLALSKFCWRQPSIITILPVNIGRHFEECKICDDDNCTRGGHAAKCAKAIVATRTCCYKLTDNLANALQRSVDEKFQRQIPWACCTLPIGILLHFVLAEAGLFEYCLVLLNGQIIT